MEEEEALARKLESCRNLRKIVDAMSDNPWSLLVQEAACRAVHDTFATASPVRVVRLTTVGLRVQLWHKIRQCRERFASNEASSDALDEMGWVYRAVATPAVFVAFWGVRRLWGVFRRLAFPALAIGACIATCVGGPQLMETTTAALADVNVRF
jgi:hypothetical protein